MADIPCTNRIVCPGPATSLDADDPIINFSSEAVDGVNFTEMAWPITDFINPFTPDDPNNPPDTCDSPISQEEAELCAIRKAFQDQAAFNGRGGQIFFSGVQTCAFNCPDGTAFFWTVPAGAFADFSQSSADQKAKAYACQQVLRNAVCIAVESTSCCVGSNFLSVVTVDGGFPPYAIKIIAGSLPPGIGFVQDTNTTGFFSGVPTTPGLFPIALSARDTHGNIMTRTVNLAVLAISNSNSIPQPSVGTFYNFQLQASGGTAPYRFAGGAGLPGGLVLQSDGFIVGNPVAPIGTGFTATVTDAAGNACSFALTYSACSFFQNIVWPNPPTQIQQPFLHVPPNSGSATISYPKTPDTSEVLISGNCVIIPGNPDLQTSITNNGLVSTGGYTGDCKISVNATMTGNWTYQVFVSDPTLTTTYFDTGVVALSGNLSTTFTFTVPAIPQINVHVLMLYGLNNNNANSSGSLRVDFGT